MKNFSKHVIASLLAILILFASCGEALAVGNLTDIKETTIIDNPTVQPMVTQSSRGSLYPGQTISLIARLPNYIGFYKDLAIRATCDSYVGTLQIAIVDPHGKTAKQLTLGANDSTKETFFLPFAGDWKIFFKSENTMSEIRVEVSWV